MILRTTLCLLLGAGLALPAAAVTSDAEEGTPLARALGAAAEGDWAEAEALAGRAQVPLAEEIVLWSRLADGSGSWAEYSGFLARSGDWPAVAAVRRHAERAMPGDLPATEVLAFFEGGPPETGTGVQRLAEALEATGRGAEAAAALVRGWREAGFTAAEQTLMLASHQAVVAEEHVARLDRLLWYGRTREAERMLTLVDPDWQALAQARIAVRRDADGSTAAINAVPPALRGDPGLAFERYLYRIDRGRWEDAEAYLLANSTSEEALGRPERWMEHRERLARLALSRGKPNAAYRLVAQNFGQDGADFAEAEWLAGYLALTRFDDAPLAAEHFRRFSEVVRTPISLGRAGFWLGRALERAGEPEAALRAYRAGARHQTSFYGQLAAEAAGLAPNPRLGESIAIPDWREIDPSRVRLAEAGRLFAEAGDDGRARQFLRAAAEGAPAAERAALAQMAQEVLGRTDLGIRLAKDAAGDGVLLPAHYYPLHGIAEREWQVPSEFALAIARQESEMNEAALSPAGARGLMQLMPGTAEEMARAVGIAYDPERLSRDGIYNARLGTEYLSRMLRRYDGSYVLASAAYNAGPGRVDVWLGSLGDPRRDDVDAVDWIETIPFSETRNYVMRVMEGLHVYRARLEGSAVPIRLVADINRGE